MKKIKIITVIILVVSVVGIGVLGAKKLLQILEEKSSRASRASSGNAVVVKPIPPEHAPLLAGDPASSSPLPDNGHSASESAGKNSKLAGHQTPMNAVSGSTPVNLSDLPASGVQGLNADTSFLDEKWVAFAAQKGVNVRSGPSTGDKLLFLVGKGTKGSVTARENGWSEIKWDFNRKSGWVRDDLLLTGPEEVMRDFVRPDGTVIASYSPEAVLEATKKLVAIHEPDLQKPNELSPLHSSAGKFSDVPFTAIASGEKWVAFAAQKGVNVRAGPSTSDKLLFLVGKGTKGTVTGQDKGWSEIKWDFNRKSGWVRNDLLLMGSDEVMRNFVAPDGTIIASFTPEAMKKVTKKAREISKNISVGVARASPPSETVKGFIGGKLPEEGIVTIDGAKLRENPSTKAAVVGKLHKGVSVKIKNVKQVGKYQWFDVDYMNGRKQGWTREDNIRF